MRVLWDMISTCKGWREGQGVCGLHGVDLGLVTKLENLGARRMRGRGCVSLLVPMRLPTKQTKPGVVNMRPVL